MWFSALKLGVNAATHIYKKKKKTKMKMADAQLMHADKMARGEKRVPGQIVRSKTIGLERRVRFARVNVCPILVIAWGSYQTIRVRWTR